MGILSITTKNVLHSLYLCLNGRAVFDTEQLTAPFLEVLDHHSSERVVRVDHLVIYSREVTREVVSNPVVDA
jgi:hypothetical protein